jgi:hypothetical protein
MGEARFCAAAEAVASRGVPLVVQVLDLDAEAARAERLLERALGPARAGAVEINRVPLLPYGRAAAIHQGARRRPAAQFGACRAARSPVIRYDGTVTACCNEAVIMGGGPAWFRRRADTAEEVAGAVAHYRDDPMLAVIGRQGVGRLADRPAAADLASREFAGICGACWTLVARLARTEAPEPA